MKKLVTESGGSSLEYDLAIAALQECYEPSLLAITSPCHTQSHQSHRYKNILNIILQTKANLRGFEMGDTAAQQNVVTATNLKRHFDIGFINDGVSTP